MVPASFIVASSKIAGRLGVVESPVSTTDASEPCRPRCVIWPLRRDGQGDRLLKEECARYGWQPEPHQIIYRANILIAETDEKAQQALAQYPRQAVFPLKAGVAAGLLELDQRNVAGEGRRPANINRALPINFCGGSLPAAIAAPNPSGPGHSP
jgi:hypothetical protein